MAIIARTYLSDILGLTKKGEDSFKMDREKWDILRRMATSQMHLLPKDAAELVSSVCSAWKEDHEKDFSSMKIFCGGLLHIKLEHELGRTFVTVFYTNDREGRGERYIIREEVHLPADFGKIWRIVWALVNHAY